ARKLVAVAARRADVLQRDGVEGALGRDVAAVAGPQLVDLRRAEDVREVEREEAVLLEVRAREGDARVGAEGLGDRAVVPEPAPRELLLAAAPEAVVADRVLVVGDRRDAGELAGEVAERAARQRPAPALADARDEERAAVARVLDVEDVDGHRVDLRRGQAEGRGQERRG